MACTQQPNKRSTLNWHQWITNHRRGSTPFLAEATAASGTSESEYVRWDGSDWKYVTGGATVEENDELKAAGTPPFGTSYTIVRHTCGDDRSLARTWLTSSGSQNIDTSGAPHLSAWLFLPASNRQGVWNTWKHGTEGGASSQGTGIGYQVNINRKWLPFPWYFDQSNQETDRPWVLEQCPGDAALNEGLVFYTVTTIASEGLNGVAYPVDRGSAAGVGAPDEDAVISTPSTSDEYLINTTLYVPTDILWRVSSEPIITFWQDANNYVEIVHNKGLLRATPTVGGVTGSAVDNSNVVLFRDQTFDIGITKDSSNNMKVFGSYPGNASIQEVDLSTQDITPTEIRFSNADKSAYQCIAFLAAHYVPNSKTIEQYELFIRKPLEDR